MGRTTGKVEEGTEQMRVLSKCNQLSNLEQLSTDEAREEWSADSKWNAEQKGWPKRHEFGEKEPKEYLQRLE